MVIFMLSLILTVIGLVIPKVETGITKDLSCVKEVSNELQSLTATADTALNLHRTLASSDVDCIISMHQV